MNRISSLVALAACCALSGACSDDETTPQPTPLPSSMVFDQATLFPEGAAFAASERAFFVGSLGGGSITRIDADGSQQVIFPEASGWSTLGMKVSKQGELVVCAVFAYGEPQTEAEIWSFDVATGARTHVVPLKGAFAEANCNDVAFDADGMVYVTDRENPNLYRVSLANETAEVFVTDAALETGVIGNNGIVYRDGVLLMGKYAPAKMLRIELSDPTALTEVTLSGDEVGMLPNGFDGMVWDGDVLTIAGNSQVFRATSADNWNSAQLKAYSPPVNIAAVTVAEGQVYGLKGEIVAYVLSSDPDLPFELLALDF